MSDEQISAVTSRLAELRGDIDTRLETYLTALPSTLGISISQNGELILDRLKDFSVRPGKRIRGALAVIGYQMFGGKKQATGLDLAVAVELVQNYLLIVDDVMDRSVQRRGSITIHKHYQKMLRRDFSAREYEHLGNMLGINAGLITQHLAARVLNEIDEAPDRVVRAERLFHTNIAATGFGQVDDLMNEAGQALDLAGTRHMYMLKSSYYTFINPLQLGAVLAGAGDEELAPLREFGQHAGVAFQLQDDIIGMFGDERTTGKSAMDDLREGKMTFLMRHALGHANDTQLQTIEAALGNKDVTVAQHAKVQAVLEQLGSRQYVEAEAQKAVASALAVLDTQAAWDKPTKAFLSGLLEYIVSRKN